MNDDQNLLIYYVMNSITHNCFFAFILSVILLYQFLLTKKTDMNTNQKPASQDASVSNIIRSSPFCFRQSNIKDLTKEQKWYWRNLKYQSNTNTRGKIVIQVLYKNIRIILAMKLLNLARNLYNDLILRKSNINSISFKIQANTRY